jgi:hypothetical protein
MRQLAEIPFKCGIPMSSFHPSVGRCIYCGSTSGELTEEHIIPYGLGGELVLADASCSKCATITSQFETEVMRYHLLDVRAYLNLRTRRKSKRPKEFPINRGTEDAPDEINIPIARRPMLMSLPIWNGPFVPTASVNDKKTHLEGYAYVPVVPGGWPGWADRCVELASELSTNNIGITQSVRPVAWSRLIAKVAYGFLVYFEGPDALRENYVLESILDHSIAESTAWSWIGNIGYTVAPMPNSIPLNNTLNVTLNTEVHNTERTTQNYRTGYLFDTAQGLPVREPRNTLHDLHIYPLDNHVQGTIRLLATAGAPEYIVSLGTNNPDAKWEWIEKQAAAAQRYESTKKKK